MASQEYVQKLREERLAKEKARIQKLRELNLKKYGHTEPTTSTATNHSTTLPLKSKSTTSTLVRNNSSCNPIKNQTKPLKNQLSFNQNANKPLTAQDFKITKNNLPLHNVVQTQNNGMIKKPNNIHSKDSAANKLTNNFAKPKSSGNSRLNDMKNNRTIKNPANSFKLQKSMSVPARPPKPNNASRQSLIPRTTTVQNSRESVFERLYKPKIVQKPAVDDVHKLRHDPNFLKKVISASNLITNRRHTTFETKSTKQPIRRSISAVHLKKISKSEIKNCIHKWASIGEKIDKASLKDINEDEDTHEEKVVSAVKSERKKVKFQTPLNNPEEMLSKLNKWLRLRGKTIDSYPHLKCFGIPHHEIEIPKFDYDDENKENIALDHDSDNESFTELNCKEMRDMDKWRSPSCVDSVDFNESYQTTMTSEISPREDELLLGALNHLTELLKLGYNWEDCARWLRTIRDRYSRAQETAAYWECRALLEERRGDLPASMQCWEQAVCKGTESSVAEASLDQLLDKFMQLKINPTSGKKNVEAKLVDAKNVFKSTLIRFAIQEARNSMPKVTVTPVRRSTRLSCYQKQTPLKLFSTIQQAIESEHAEFRPNRAMAGTP
ncbi:uncharacterized protein LOC119838236 [Zerene cesonia]|uniref:uncharacterized protein LOC119838236 n=1 Tax=Zerene cesonia TaxID=33412 RepID=UPI0018E50457|nr:uncharacterized protein LOC119838236 [Zerene cesonia]